MMNFDREILLRYDNVVRRINQISREKVGKPLLVIASKMQIVDKIRLLHDERGHLHFGENYVQELVSKARKLPSTVRWHFIGHLQSNKCRNLIFECPNLYMIETVDSIRLATILQKCLEEYTRKNQAAHKILNVLVQYNTSSEESKSGITSFEDCLGVIQHIINCCPNLRFKGLMTIGRQEEEAAIEDFEKLVKLKEQILNSIEKFKELFSEDSQLLHSCKDEDDDERRSFFELSMGTSTNFEAALRGGATEVRVGSSVFGPREEVKEQQSVG